MRTLLAVALAITCSSANARDIYVDNLVGSDQFDGRLQVPTDSGSGPVRSLRRAMQLVNFGDRVVLKRAGAVYYDSLSFTGSRFSGSPQNPFTLVGNGATLSGLRVVPPAGWRPAGQDLWKLTLTRKGFNRLLRDGKLLPEVIPGDSVNPLESLNPGEWVAWRGSLYFRQDGDRPATQQFTYAAEQTGLTLYQVSNVRITDVTFRDFRFDGVHAQNMCESVVLENVNCINNGRAGVAISGTSDVEVIGGRMADNGRAQIRLSHPGGLNLRDVEMEGEPTLIK